MPVIQRRPLSMELGGRPTPPTVRNKGRGYTAIARSRGALAKAEGQAAAFDAKEAAINNAKTQAVLSGVRAVAGGIASVARAGSAMQAASDVQQSKVDDFNFKLRTTELDGELQRLQDEWRYEGDGRQSYEQFQKQRDAVLEKYGREIPSSRAQDGQLVSERYRNRSDHAGFGKMNVYQVQKSIADTQRVFTADIVPRVEGNVESLKKSIETAQALLDGNKLLDPSQRATLEKWMIGAIRDTWQSQAGPKAAEQAEGMISRLTKERPQADENSLDYRRTGTLPKGPVSADQFVKVVYGMHEGRNRAVLSAALSKYGGVKIDPAKTPWCAAFVNATLGANGRRGTGSLAARSFLNYGTKVGGRPERGDIVVFSRGNDPSKGHVGFFEGFTKSGDLIVLGGNQDNKVSLKAYSASRLLGVRRPPPIGGPLPPETQPGDHYAVRRIMPKLTAYSPQMGGDKMEGGYPSKWSGPDGKALVRTLQDVFEKRSAYVTVAADPKYRGQEFTIPSITYLDKDGNRHVMTNVRAVAHDIGPAIKGKNRFDVAVARDASDMMMMENHHLWEQEGVQFVPTGSRSANLNPSNIDPKTYKGNMFDRFSGSLAPDLDEIKRFSARRQVELDKHNAAIAAEKWVKGVIAGEVEMNPQNPKHRKLIDQAFERPSVSDKLFAGDPETMNGAIGLIERIQYVPKAVAEALKGLMHHRDQDRRVRGYETVGNILGVAPFAFKPVSGGEELVDLSTKFNGLVKRSGKTSEEAVAHMEAIKTPEWQAKSEARSKEAAKLGAQLSTADMTKEFGTTWLGMVAPSMFADARNPSATMVRSAFTNEFRKAYIEMGDANAAKYMAAQNMRIMFGVTEISGSRIVMRYPPDNPAFYPKVADSYDYMTKDLERDVRIITGSKVPASQISIYSDDITQSEVARIGAKDARGQIIKPTYKLYYVDPKDGIQKLAPGRWHPNVERAKAEFLERFKTEREEYLKKQAPIDEAARKAARDADEQRKRVQKKGFGR